MINIDALNDDEKLAALESIHKSIAESKEIQKKKITTNVELIVKALKKIESDLKQRYDETGQLIANLKNGEDGRDGKDGKDGKNGKDGRDGLMGPRGYDGVPGRNGLDGADGVSVTDAHIDFDGSLIISLSSGRVINVGEVVAADIAEKIKVITNGGGTSQGVLDAIASLQAQIDSIASGLEYQGTWNASTNVPTLASSVGTAGYYYIVSTAGSTNLNGVTDWQVGDWAVFNGTIWQKIDQTNLVTSVAGRTGAIVLTTADIGGLGTIATQAANNVSITGGSITGITDLAIADGGTGASTAAAAITALTGTQTSGFYLRSNGTGAFLSAIQAGDVPTLNQSTTGSAATLSLTNPVSRGGTNLTSLTNKGVLYASSTSQVATGTALQFDGTNFAVGTTPSAFGSTFRAVEVGDLASLAFESNGVTKKTYLSTNSYNATNTGARPYYKANGLASEYSQNVGEHAWFTAPTGIAGSSTTITTGKIYTNLTVGNQTDFGAPSNAIGTIWTATSSGTLNSGTVVQNIDFVESMRIDASSNVGIGISTPGSKLDVKGTLRLSGSTSGYVGLAPAAAAGSTTYTLPSADGTNGQSLTTNGSGTLSWASGTGGTVTSVAMTVPSFLSVSGSPITSSGTLAVSLSGTALPIANGGTGQITANAAFNALVPSQTGNSGKYLTTNGTDTSWATNPLGTVTSVGGTGTVNGLTLTGTVTTSGNLTLGGTLDLSSPPAIGNTAANTGAFTTLSASSTVTLSGGTANGVAYLNGSKVVTSGSALTFDGTNLAVTGGSVTAGSTQGNAQLIYGSVYGGIQFRNNTTAQSDVVGDTSGNLFSDFLTSAVWRNSLVGTNELMRLTSTGLGIGTSSPYTKLQVTGTIKVATGNAQGILSLGDGNGSTVNCGIWRGAANAPTTDGNYLNFGGYDGLVFAVGNAAIGSQSEVGRFTSTGLGIGTSSPAAKLDVSQATAGSNAAKILHVNGNGIFINPSYNYYDAYNHIFRSLSGSTTYATIDNSGNLGLGVTPTSTWATNRKVLQLGGSAGTVVAFNGISGSGEQFYNSYFNTSSQNIYNTTTYAGKTDFNIASAGGFTWQLAPSGTAGNAITFTQAMTLDASGNLGVGTTSIPTVGSTQVLAVGNSNGGTLGIVQSGSIVYRISASTTGVDFYTGNAVPVIFYTSGSERARIDSSGNFGIGTSSPSYKLDVNNASGGLIGRFVNGSGRGNVRLDGYDDTTLQFYRRGASVGFVQTDSSGADLIAGTTGAFPFIFYTNNAEKARIDSSGNFLVGATSQFGGADCKLQGKNGSSAQSVSFLWNATTTGDANFVAFGTEATVTQRGSITYNRAGGLTAYNTTSDYRAKDISGPVTGSGALIDSVPVYMGKMKGATQERPMFIAHETPAYAHTGEKDAVDTDGNPVYQQMDASALIPVMWAEIQSLRKRLADAGL